MIYKFVENSKKSTSIFACPFIIFTKKVHIQKGRVDTVLFNIYEMTLLYLIKDFHFDVTHEYE